MNAARLFQRKRHYTKAQLNDQNWPHPRPAHDPRLIAGYLCIIAPSIIQVFGGIAPTSMQGRNDFDFATTIAFAVIAVVSSLLILYAAFCVSQYWSFVTELLGCLGMVLTFAIYLWGIRLVPDFWATNSAWWSLAVVVGHSYRAWTIGRRFW